MLAGSKNNAFSGRTTKIRRNFSQKWKNKNKSKDDVESPDICRVLAATTAEARQAARQSANKSSK